MTTKIQIPVYSLDGKQIKRIDLPAIFQSPHRADLIKRAVLSEESRTYQPKGNYPLAGLLTSARYRGRKEDYGAVKNKGIPHLPHEVLPGGRLGKVKRVPHAVKGRRAHPPKVQKKIVEMINKKEYLKALASALSMAADKKVVANRMKFELDTSSSHDSGDPLHTFTYALPIVVDSDFEKLKKTNEVLRVFDALNLTHFIQKSKKNKGNKSNKKSTLVVLSDNAQTKAPNNLCGVDVVRVKDLKVKHLAPGTHGGRLTIFSENALPELMKRFVI